jgi:hypothetical protein
MTIELSCNVDEVSPVAVLIPVSLEVSKDKALEDAKWMGGVWGY